MEALFELTQSVSTWNPAGHPADEFDYIDLSAVDNIAKQIVSPTTVMGAAAPSRARQLVAAGDVLVSTVRPNLNAVAVVPDQLDNATASTGFTVLRPGNKLDGRYLFHWVRSPRFITDMVRKATGASYPAVSDRIVKESTIPVQPVDEQRRIAAILDQADALRTKRRQVLAHLDSLTQSIFHDMFGDPVTNERGLPTQKLGVLGQLDRGVSKHRPRNDPALLGGAYPLIQTGDVANSGGYITSFTSTYSELGLAQSRLWPAGTLCITIAANIAKTGVLEFDACFPDSVVGFTADPETTTYVRVWLSFLQATLEASAPQSAQKNVNLAVLRNLDVPTPNRTDLVAFAASIDQLRVSRATAVEALRADDELFASLQSRAFKGEL